MHSPTLISNKRALGDEITQKISTEKVSIRHQNVVSDYVSLILTGLGVSQILIQGKRKEHKELAELIDRNPHSYIHRYNSYPLTTREINFQPSDQFICENHSLNVGESIFHAINQGQKFLDKLTVNTHNSTKSPFNYNEHKKLPRNILLIGAGGIGTYIGLELALRKYDNLTIIDDDVIEEKNLNRQLLYSQNIGSSKAKILAEKTHEIGIRQTEGIKQKIHSSQELIEILNTGKYDLIYSAVDNFTSRYHISKACEKKQIPLIEGGCDTSCAITTQYIPSLTAPTHITRNHQAFFSFDKKKETNSCSQNVNPSVIIPNIVAAHLMVGLTYHPLINQTNLRNELLSYNPSSSKPYEVLKPC